MTDPSSEVELIDPGEEDESEVSVGNPARHLTTLMLVAGLMIVALLVWLLTRSTDPDEPGPDQAVIEEGVGDTPTTTLVVPTTTPAPTLPTTLVPGVAVLGERTGLWLFYGGDDNLQRVDLDDGTTAGFGLRAHPIATLQGELVVASSAANAVGWIGLDDPGEQAEGWKVGRLAFDGDGVHMQFLEGGRWTRISLPSGQIVESQPALAPAPQPVGYSGRPALVVPGPELVSTSSGIYALDDEGRYSRVRPSGQVLHHDTDRVLVQDCGSDLLECRSAWFRRSDWRELEFPAPGRAVGFAEVLGGGVWLHTIDVAGEHQLLLLGPSPETALEASFTIEVDIESLSVSPDGRWLAVKRPGDDVIELIDLTTGKTEKRYSGFSARSTGSLLFVAKPTTS